MNKGGLCPILGAMAIGADAEIMLGWSVFLMAGQAGGVGGVVNLQILPVLNIIVAVGAGARVTVFMIGFGVATFAIAHP